MRSSEKRKERSAVPSWMKYADGFQLHQHLCRGKLTAIFCRLEMSLWFSWVFFEGAGLSRLITELCGTNESFWFSGTEAGSLFLWNGCWLFVSLERMLAPVHCFKKQSSNVFLYGPKLVYYNASKPSIMRC